MSRSLTFILDNINIMISKIPSDKINENEELINKIIKLINKVNNIIHEIKFETSKEDKLNINKEDILEIQEILLKSINDNNNDLKIKFDNINQFIKIINFLMTNIDNIKNDSAKYFKKEKTNNINSSKTNNNKKNEIKEEIGNGNKIEENTKQLDEAQNNQENLNRKVKINNKNEKRIFDDTKVDIKGEYHKIESISKIKKKILNGYSFTYSENELVTTFLFKNSSANKEFYTCFKKGKGCDAKAFFDKTNNSFHVYKGCNVSIDHNNIKYEKFEMKCQNNELKDIDMNIKKYQRYYIRYAFKNKIAVDKYNAIDMFKEKFGNNIKFKLNDNDINVEKATYMPNPKDKTIKDLIKNLQIENNNIIIKTTDIIYDYKYFDRLKKKYNTIKREEEIIFFGTNEMLSQ